MNIDASRPVCWCLNEAFEDYSKDYFLCEKCGTLVIKKMPVEQALNVVDDNTDFYGKNYWQSHMTDDYNYPDIFTRSRVDLSERCLYWLSFLLKYKLPPAKVIEMGCSHGGFISLLQALGFDACGLELSPWVVEYAKKTFNIPVLNGTIESQSLPPHSFDAVVLMDVVEHLPQPIRTLQSCMNLLKKDGVLVIQMPDFPLGQSNADLEENNSRFIEHMKYDEHLYLFSRQAIVKLLTEAGFKYIEFEPAIFSHYDMFLFASQTPLMKQQQTDIDEVFISSAHARHIQAMLDLYNKNLELLTTLKESEADRAARLGIINQLTGNSNSKQSNSAKSVGVKSQAIKEKNSQQFVASQLRYKIAIDLTPVLPGGENGGAKIMAIELCRALGLIAPQCQFYLLTSSRNHQELISLASKNIKCICIDTNIKPKRSLLRRAINKLTRFIWKKRITNQLTELGIDLLYCPFTAPTYRQALVPIVVTVLDLQHRFYPQFFSSTERAHRDNYLREACRFANYVVCISKYVRQTVIETVKLTENIVKYIYIQTPYRLPAISQKAINTILIRLSLQSAQFLLYPANFWQHKNHEMLLTAFAMYRRKHPDSPLKLVCTGQPSSRMQELQEMLSQMGLSQHVIMPGFISNDELSALFQNCSALIFPTLYEGFGMPILEAMAYGKPVLCSNNTSLPEIAEDAALYFDARNPSEIVQAIEKLTSDVELVNQLVAKGKQQLAKFSNTENMAMQYLELFHKAIQNPVVIDSAQGIFEDGWSSDKVSIVHGKSMEPRKLKLHLSLPPSNPNDKVTVEISSPLHAGSKKIILMKDKSCKIEHPLPLGTGQLEIKFSPVFIPSEHHSQADNRTLGCRVDSCQIVTASKEVSLC